MKYLVMECNGDYAVLLDEHAGFVKAVDSGYAVGDTIENPKLIRQGRSRSAILMRVTKCAAAVAACMAVVLGINYYNQYMTAYSYVTISINPDIKMSLNRHGEVLSLVGLNEDGNVLIDGYDPDRKDKTTVSDELIDRAMEMGFLSDGDTITFEIDTPDAELSEEYGAELQSNALEHTKKMGEVEVIIRKPENAAGSVTVQPEITTTTTTAVRVQEFVTETTTTATTVSSAVSTAAAETTVTTTVTRRHKIHPAWDDDFTNRPSLRDDNDIIDNDNEYKDIDHEDDIHTDIEIDNKGDDNDIHDNFDHGDPDPDIDSRDQHDDHADSESSGNRDDDSLGKTEDSEALTETSDDDVRGEHDNESDHAEDTDALVSDESSISDDESACESDDESSIESGDEEMTDIIET